MVTVALLLLGMIRLPLWFQVTLFQPWKWVHFSLTLKWTFSPWESYDFDYKVRCIKRIKILLLTLKVVVSYEHSSDQQNHC